jgi:hypothetical protein
MRPRPPQQTGAPIVVRCKPTLYVTFRNQQIVEVERRHTARVKPVRRTGEHVPDWQRAQDEAILAAFDEGCRGPCVGDRETLPVTYFDTPR